MRLLNALAALTLLTAPAFASDLQPRLTKAPALSQAYDPVATGGWYVGLGSFLETQKATFGTTDVLSQSGAIGVVGGYGRGNGRNWWQLQGEAYWTNLSGSGVCGLGASCGVASSFTGGAWLKVGLPPGLLQALPQIGNLFPGLSVTQLADNVFPYFAAGTAPSDVSASLGKANAQAWVIPVGARLGMITKLTNGTVSDVGAEVDFAGGGFALGGAKVNPSTAYKAYIHFLIGA